MLLARASFLFCNPHKSPPFSAVKIFSNISRFSIFRFLSKINPVEFPMVFHRLFHFSTPGSCVFSPDPREFHRVFPQVLKTPRVFSTFPLRQRPKMVFVQYAQKTRFFLPSAAFLLGEHLTTQNVRQTAKIQKKHRFPYAVQKNGALRKADYAGEFPIAEEINRSSRTE